MTDPVQGSTWPIPDPQLRKTLHQLDPVRLDATLRRMGMSLVVAVIVKMFAAQLHFSFSIATVVQAMAAVFAMFQLVVYNFGCLVPSPHRTVSCGEPGKWEISTWSGSQVFTPKVVFAPKTLDDLLKIVHEYGRRGRKVKAAGSLHSWSPCAVTDDVSVHTSMMNRVLEVNKDRKTIKAEAGILMGDLYSRMDQEGLALPCLPNVDSITLGGAVVNATHGTCIQYGTMCSLVEEMEIVIFQRDNEDGSNSASGGGSELKGDDVVNHGHSKRICLRKDSDDPHERHLFSAAVASFGSIGIVYSITLRCVDPFCCYVSEKIVHYSDIEGQLKELTDSHYSLRVVTNPLTGLVMSKMQMPVRSPFLRLSCKHLYTSYDYFWLRIMAWAYYKHATTFLWLRKKLIRVLTYLSALSTGQFLGIVREGTLTWYNAELDTRAINVMSTGPVVNMEYAVPQTRIDPFYHEVYDLIKRYPSTLMTTLVMRAVGADDIGYLSPAYKQKVVYMDMPYYSELEKLGMYLEIEKLCIKYGGRCSWSRLISSQPREFLRNYPEHDKFVAAQKELDPFNVFSNQFSDRIIFANKASD